MLYAVNCKHFVFLKKIIMREVFTCTADVYGNVSTVIDWYVQWFVYRNVCMYVSHDAGFDLCFVRCYGLQNDKLRKTHKYFQMTIGVILVSITTHILYNCPHMTACMGINLHNCSRMDQSDW